MSGLVRRAVVATAPPVRSARERTRRQAFLTRVRLAAAAVDATVDLDVAADVRIGARVRVTFRPWTHSVLRIGAGSLLEDDVRLQLKGGTVRLGERVQLRRGTLCNVEGVLSVGADTIVSWGTVVHCREAVTLGERVLVGEYGTFADSSHFFTAPAETAWHNVRSAPVDVGNGCWLGAKVTVVRGARVGAHCIVGANTIVTGDVPAGSLASGVPAVVRPLALPWTV